MSLSYKSGMMSKIRCGEPITRCGLTLYPIQMSDYEQFMECRSVWTLRLGTLPVKYQMLDYISALYSLEMDTISAYGAKTGFFERAIRLFYLSLRIGVEKIADTFRITEKDIGGNRVLDELIIVLEDREMRIKSFEFSTQIRPLVAEMNGLELPDESENLDLVKDIEELQSKAQGKPLNQNLNDLISSVAYQSHVSEKEINTWTVREFEARKRAIDRDKRYMMYGQAELGGMVSFKQGNPAPSWCFDAIEDSLDNHGLEMLGKAFGQN